MFQFVHLSESKGKYYSKRFFRKDLTPVAFFMLLHTFDLLLAFL